MCEHPTPWPGDDRKEQWAQPMITMFESILNHMENNKQELPELSQEFCVENEEEWQQYVKEHGKEAKPGWWGELEAVATTNKRRKATAGVSSDQNEGEESEPSSASESRKPPAKKKPRRKAPPAKRGPISH